MLHLTLKIKIVIVCQLFIGLNLLALTPIDSLPHTNRNRVFVGGNLNFKTGQILTNETAKGYEVNLSPKAAYFVVKKLAVGLSANIFQYNYNKGTAAGNSISIGPLARYYYIIKKSAIVLELSYNYGQTEDSTATTFSFSPPPITVTFANKSRFNQYALGIGYTYFIKENVGIEALYQYKIMQQHYSNNYGLSVPEMLTKKQSSLNLGLLFYF